MDVNPEDGIDLRLANQVRLSLSKPWHAALRPFDRLRVTFLSSHEKWVWFGEQSHFRRSGFVGAVHWVPMGCFDFRAVRNGFGFALFNILCVAAVLVRHETVQ
jgi:hypothetical protein